MKCHTISVDDARSLLRGGLFGLASSYPPVCVHELFEAQVGRTPAQLAVQDRNAKLTYAELNSQSNQLANYLAKLGIGPEVLVGISMERTPRMLVALLGILKAGAAYLPLDPAFPKDRLKFMLDDARPALLLSEESFISSLPTCYGETVVLDHTWKDIARESNENPPTRATPKNLAYVLYTSGSTGKPKGVQIEHRSVVNFLTSMLREPGMVCDDVLLAVTTLSFDIAGLELYLPLTVGAQIVVADREMATDGEQLLAAIERHRITIMQATPVTWRLMLEARWGKGNLKVICGGEAMPRDLAKRLIANSSSVWNMYGPTETTIWSSVYRVNGDEPGSIPIGKPIANTQMWILDGESNPVQSGDMGELYIGGDGLARGYLNRPELNAQKFVPNPFQPNSLLYRTGDLARCMPSGDVEFFGRADQQVKIRGFRIELDEIEAVLQEQPEVVQAAVVIREVTGQTWIVGYFVPRPGTETDGAVLRHRLQEKLPSHMVPAAVLPLLSLPLTANGKIDRRALPTPSPDEITGTQTFVAPRDAVETELVEIWQKVLSRNRVGIYDNFFDLGGYSLLAVKLMRRIEQTWGKRIPIVALFQAPTIDSLAKLLRQEKEARNWSSLVTIQEGRNGKPPFFCVHGVFGEVLGFRDLARYLGPDQPVYGLQARGLDGKQSCFTRVEQMAAAYVDEIRMLQSEGPYYLGGFSFGGAIAFEMARQLHRQGQQVGLVVLLDTYPPNYKNGHLLSTIRSLPFGQKWFYFRRKIMFLVRKFNTTVSAQFLPQRLRRVRKSCAEAMNHYVPQNYPGSVVLFRASERPLGSLNDDYIGWDKLALGGVELYHVSGDHLTLVQGPQTVHLASQLKMSLERAFERNAYNPVSSTFAHTVPQC